MRELIQSGDDSLMNETRRTPTTGTRCPINGNLLYTLTATGGSCIPARYRDRIDKRDEAHSENTCSLISLREYMFTYLTQRIHVHLSHSENTCSLISLREYMFTYLTQRIHVHLSHSENTCSLISLREYMFTYLTQRIHVHLSDSCTLRTGQDTSATETATVM